MSVHCLLVPYEYSFKLAVMFFSTDSATIIYTTNSNSCNFYILDLKPTRSTTALWISCLFIQTFSEVFVLIQLMFCSWWSPMKPSSSTFLLSATALNSDTALCNCWSLSNWCQFSIDWIYYIPFICKANEIQYHKDNGLIMCWYFNCPISWLENVNGFPNQNRY